MTTQSLRNIRSSPPRRSTPSPSATLRRSFEAYLQRIARPDVKWIDLLRALGRSTPIAEDAALLLHSKLAVPRPKKSVNRSPTFWRRTLARRGINPYDPVQSASGPSTRKASCLRSTAT